MIINNNKYNRFMGFYGSIILAIFIGLGSLFIIFGSLAALMFVLWVCSLLFHTDEFMIGLERLTDN